MKYLPVEFLIIIVISLKMVFTKTITAICFVGWYHSVKNDYIAIKVEYNYNKCLATNALVVNNLYNNLWKSYKIYLSSLFRIETLKMMKKSTSFHHTDSTLVKQPSLLTPPRILQSQISLISLESEKFAEIKIEVNETYESVKFSG